MTFTHEQTQKLLDMLRSYRLWIADMEYRAEVKNPEIMDGMIAMEKAERFIAQLDAETEKQAAQIDTRWSIAQELDGTEAAKPIKMLREMPQAGTKWQLHCMNAAVDGIIINDFESDAEAAQYAANYEARCYRIDPDGKRTLIYNPAEAD